MVPSKNIKVPKVASLGNKKSFFSRAWLNVSIFLGLFFWIAGKPTPAYAAPTPVVTSATATVTRPSVVNFQRESGEAPPAPPGGGGKIRYGFSGFDRGGNSTQSLYTRDFQEDERRSARADANILVGNQQKQLASDLVQNPLRPVLQDSINEKDIIIIHENDIFWF